MTLPEPTAFDSPERFDAFLNAVRRGAVSTPTAKTFTLRFTATLTLKTTNLSRRRARRRVGVAHEIAPVKTVQLDDAELVAQERSVVEGEREGVRLQGLRGAS